MTDFWAATDEEIPAEAEPARLEAGWSAWKVAKKSGFEVHADDGRVGLVQIDRKQFLVEREFRFSNKDIVRYLQQHLVRDWKKREAKKPEKDRKSDAELEQAAAKAVDDARTFTPSDENPTDLASIPRYMRWFETAYGYHTLAAIIHDNLIRDTPNDGALGDDTLSDRFFREMMRYAGVPWLKRWIMWSAVALRSRWAVGGVRRWSVILWLLLALTGITSFVWFIASLGGSAPVDEGALLAIALVLPVGAAFLWGKQYGAGIVAAAVALWIMPAAVLAGIGYGVYRGLEWAAGRVGLK